MSPTTSASTHAAYIRGAESCKLASEPIRNVILLRLMDGESGNRELAELAGVDDFLLRHHLRILRLAGAVEHATRGRTSSNRLTERGRKLAAVVEALGGAVRP